jgi:cellulose synthase/poly-beta-1,6-N-acetylglucosamine synthase-like glycosyltransferase
MEQPPEAAAASARDPVASVIVPARDEETTIGGCLQALARQTLGPRRLEVIVVASGGDDTAETATREGTGRFGRFEVLRLQAGNKNAALRHGCANARADMVVLLDADTEPDPTALAAILDTLAHHPRSVAHGAMRARCRTAVARYSELQRNLVKELHFDGHLSGGLIALPRAALPAEDLPRLLPDEVGAIDDAYLGNMLRQGGWQIVYAPTAIATTLFPWTLRALLASLLRNRRGTMTHEPLPQALLQGAKSLVLLAGVPLALLLVSRSLFLAVVCTLPLLAHIALLVRRIRALRARGLDADRLSVPVFIALDLAARGLKLWAVIERVLGRRPPTAFRGERIMAGGTGASRGH